MIDFARPPIAVGQVISLHFTVDGPARLQMQRDGPELMHNAVARALQSFTPDPDIDRQIAEAKAAVAEQNQLMEALHREAIERQQKKLAKLALAGRRLGPAAPRLGGCGRESRRAATPGAIAVRAQVGEASTVAGAARRLLENRWEGLLAEFQTNNGKSGAEWLADLTACQQAMCMVRNEASVAALIRQHHREMEGASA